MHIPDGYLSPSTCAALYATASPFWYVALKKVKAQLHTKLVPRIALFAAFSFVVMMFNIPLPGGTGGHATGVGLAAVVLGPWAGILAISTTLLIQALFYGDGGISTFGANSFNMAIVGCLVTYAVYRLLLRVFATRTWGQAVSAAIAAYIAINVSAFCAAIEFGVQPALFKDASGHPLYCPFPLNVAIPAMMIGHLTFFGLAELFITGGVVAYLKKAFPDLIASPANAEASAKPFVAVLAILILLTPLGLLTSSAAFGEWSSHDFKTRMPEVQCSKLQIAPPFPRKRPKAWHA